MRRTCMSLGSVLKTAARTVPLAFAGSYSETVPLALRSRLLYVASRSLLLRRGRRRGRGASSDLGIGRRGLGRRSRYAGLCVRFVRLFSRSAGCQRGEWGSSAMGRSILVSAAGGRVR